MKKLLLALITTAVLSGCTATPTYKAVVDGNHTMILKDAQSYTDQKMYRGVCHHSARYSHDCYISADRVSNLQSYNGPMPTPSLNSGIRL